jgi:hypothetical protein
MQLETIKPSCGRLAAPGLSFEGFVPWDADVFTNRKRRGVNEGNTLRAATTALPKDCQRDQQIRHRLDKAAAAQQVGECRSPICLYAILIKPLENPVARLMVVHQNREHFAVSNACGERLRFLFPCVI